MQWSASPSRLASVSQRNGHSCDWPHDDYFTEGQVILPKAIRDQLKWDPGTRLTVERTADGVLLKPLTTTFALTQPNDVFGCLSYKGGSKSAEEMDAGIATEVKRRHAKVQY